MKLQMGLAEILFFFLDIHQINIMNWLSAIGSFYPYVGIWKTWTAC